MNLLARLQADPLAGVVNEDALRLLPEGLHRIGIVATPATVQRCRAARPEVEWTELACAALETSHAAAHPAPLFDACVLDGVLGEDSAPLALLGTVKQLLKPQGVVVLSVRNARHWSQQAMLAHAESGTPAHGERLLTREAAHRLLAQGGFHADAAVGRVHSPPEAERYLAAIRNLALLSGGDPQAAEAEAKVLQYVLRAYAQA